MLEIHGLAARIDDKDILRGIDLTVPKGEVHAIMGPNGSGKSTLGYVLAGREGYELTGGTATFEGADLLEMEPEERAAAGLFLAFQAPLELPGVNNANFLRTALNAIRRARGEAELSGAEYASAVADTVVTIVETSWADPAADGDSDTLDALADSGLQLGQA